jgi:hypothetical protein
VSASGMVSSQYSSVHSFEVYFEIYDGCDGTCSTTILSAVGLPCSLQRETEESTGQYLTMNHLNLGNLNV